MATATAKRAVGLGFLMFALALATPSGRVSGGVFDNVPAAETAGMQLVYELTIPVTGNWNNVAVPYSVNNAASIPNGSFTRVAYYMELNGSWVYASFDAAGFTNNASKTGVPNLASAEYYRYGNTTISNMNVYSNVGSIVTGTGISTGNVEFWATNYTNANAFGVPGASGTVYDFGDQDTAGTYGSMQVHNYGAAQTLFAYNNWNSNNTSCLGIGNAPTGERDWTFNTNAGSYTTRLLQVLVGTPVALSELTWDGPTGDWTSAQWTPGPVPGPNDLTTKGVVKAGTVTVNADRMAYSLEQTGGTLVVGQDNSLTLDRGIQSTVGTVSLLNGSTLATNFTGGSIANLSVTGTATVDVHSGTLAVTNLTMASNLTKQGAGVLDLQSIAASPGSTFTIEGGTLKATGAAPLTNLSQVTLDGGTLAVQGATVFGNVLQAGRFADGNFAQNFSASGGAYTDDGVGIFSGQQLLATTPGMTKTQTGDLSYGSTAAFNTYWGTTGDPNEWQAVWTGYYVAQVAGVHQFRIENAGGGADIDDDGSLWVDGDQSGTFEATEGGTTAGALTVTTVALTAGQRYAVAFGFNENGGGESYRVRFLEPAGGTYTALTTVNPTTQTGYWESQIVGGIDMTSTDIAVLSNSGINAITDATAAFGSLVIHDGATLTTGGGVTTFADLHFAGSAGRTAGIANSNAVTIPVFDDDGVATTFVKSGTGTLSLLPNVTATATTFRVNAGILAVQNPNLLGGSSDLVLGGGTFQPNGGGAAVNLSGTDVTVVTGTTTSAISPTNTGAGVATFRNLTLEANSTLTLSGSRSNFAITDFLAGSSLVISNTSDGLGTARTSGNANIGGTGRAEPTTYSDQGTAGTMRLYGSATLALTGSVTANNTIFRLEGTSVLDATGAAPLGAGDTRVTLAGGTLRVTPVPANTDLAMTTTDISVVANSTLNAVNTARTFFDTLSFDAGATLTITASAGGRVYFDETTFTAPGSGTPGGTISTSVHTWTGAIDGAGLGGLLRKQGTADLILNEPAVNVQNTVLQAEAGRIVAIGGSSLGNATLALKGGEVVLASPDGNDVTYNARIRTANTGTSTLTAGSGGYGVPGGAVILPDLAPSDRAIITMRVTDADYFLLPNGVNPTGAPITVPNALTHYGYHVNSDAAVMDLNNNAGMVNYGNPTAFTSFYGKSLLTAGPANRGLDFDSDTDFINSTSVNQADNFSQLWIGKLTVPAGMGGNWNFRINNQDDPAGIWIDLDRDGVFESSTAGLGSDRGEQLAWNQAGSTKTRALTEGLDYMVAFTHREGGGTSWVDIQFQAPGSSVWTSIRPADPAQDGLWSALMAPSGGLDIAQGETRTLGALYLGTLILGTGGTLNRASLAPADRDITVTNTLTLNKDLDMTHGETLTTVGATVNVNAGATLYLNQPLNAATLNLSGNLTRTGSPSGPAPDVTVTQALNLNSTLTFAGGSSLNAPNATVTVNPTGVLNSDVPVVARTLASSGTVRTAGGTLTDLSVTGGTTTLTANTTVTGVFSGAAPGILAAANTLTLDVQGSAGFDGTVRVDSGHMTLNVPASNTAVPVAGRQFHIAASALVGYINNQTVSNWTDISGAGHHANIVQSDPVYTTNVLNSLPVVRFDGDDFLRTSYNFDPLTSYSVVSVARYNGTTAIDSERVISSATRNWLFGFHGNGIERWHAESWIYNVQVAANNTDWQLHAGTMLNAADPLAAFWRNGVLLTSNNTGSGNGNHMIGQLQLNGYSGGELSNSDIAEVLIYDRVLSSGELNVIGGYLAAKYALATSYYSGPSVGDIRLAPDTQITFGGAGTPRINSMGTTTGPVATGSMLLAAGANLQGNSSGDTLTANATIGAASFKVTGSGTIALTQNLTVAAGGTMTSAATANISALNTLTIDAGQATVNLSGGLNVASGTLTIRTPAPSALPTGAVGYWTFDDGASLGNDSTANNNDGAVLGGVTYAAGSLGSSHVAGSGAAVFNGSTGYIRVADSASLDSAAGTSISRTVAFWLKTTANQNLVVLEKGTNTQFVIQTEASPNAGKITFRVDTTNTPRVFSTAAVNDDTWHHFLATYSGTGNVMNLYIDGVFQGTNTQASPAANNSPLVIGARDGGSFFYPGSMDDLAVWSRTLTPAEIQSVYLAGLQGGFGPAALGHLTMADATTLDLADAAGVSGAGAGAFRSITTGSTANILGTVKLLGDMTLGASPGTLNVTGSFTMAPGSTYHWETDGVIGDLVAVTGAPGSVDVSSYWNLGISLDGAVSSGSYDIMTFTSGVAPAVGAVSILKENSWAQLISSATVGSDNDSVFVTLNMLADTTWTSNVPGQTNWQTPGNWDNGVPTASTAAIVQAPTATEVATILPGDTGQAQMLIIGNNGTVQVNNGGTLQVGAGGIYVDPTGTLRLDQGSTLDAALVNVTGGTLTGPNWPPSRRATLDPATTVRLESGTLAGNLAFTNPSTTAGSYALEVESGSGSANLYGPAASLRKSTAGAATFSGEVTLNNIRVEAGSLTFAHGPALTANNVTVTGGTLQSNKNATIGTLDLQGGTTTLTRHTTVTDTLKGSATLIADGSFNLDLSSASRVDLSGTLRVAGSYAPTSGNLTVVLPAGGGTPIFPSGLLYRLDAAVGVVTDGSGNVSQWGDQSGTGRNFLQGTLGNQPDLVAGALNGLPVVRFDGADDRLTLSSATSPYTVFIVNRSNTQGGLQGIWGSDNPSDKGIRMAGAPAWSHPGDGNDFTNGAGGAMYINGTAGSSFGSLGTYHILEAVRGASSPVTYNVTQLGWYYSGRILNGDIAEMLVFSGALSAQDRNDVGGYLAAKYGLSSSYTGGLSGIPRLGNLQLDPDSRITLAGAGVAKFDSIGATGGLTINNNLTVQQTASGPANISGTATGVHFNADVTTANFTVTGPGTVSLGRDTVLNITSGGKLSVPVGVTLSGQAGAGGTATVNASQAGIDFKGGLNVASGTLVLNAPTPVAMPQAANNIGYWPLSEGSGTTTADRSAGNNPGTINTGAAWVNDATRGWVLNFPAAGSVTIPTAAFSSLAGQGQVTISLWQYGNVANQPRADTIFGGNNAAGNRVIQSHLPWSDSNVYWDAGNSGGTWNRIYKGATSAEFEGAWHNWVYVKDASTGALRIYLDGNLWHSGTGLNLNMETITAFRIGSNASGAESYYGMIDEFAVWNRPLTLAQVQDVYRAGLQGGFGATRFGDLTMVGGTHLVASQPVGFSTATVGGGTALNPTTMTGDITIDRRITPTGSGHFLVNGPTGSDGHLRISDGLVYEWSFRDRNAHDLIEVLGDLHFDKSFTLRIFGEGGSIQATDYLPIFLYTGLLDVPAGGLEYTIEIGNRADPDHLYIWDDSGAELFVGLYEGQQGIWLHGLIAQAIPEPGTLTVLALGALALLRRRRRRAAK